MKLPFPTACFSAIVITLALSVWADDVVDIGSRRELFVDATLIDRLDGVERKLHHPVPRDTAITHPGRARGVVITRSSETAIYTACITVTRRWASQTPG
jgi:hypothetical protein